MTRLVPLIALCVSACAAPGPNHTDAPPVQPVSRDAAPQSDPSARSEQSEQTKPIPQIAQSEPAARSTPATKNPIKEPDLRRQLLERKDQDQQARTAVPFDTDRCAYVDFANTEWMKVVVAAYGWPGRSLVGADGAFAAWLLVQHADRDPDFQAHCLTLMEEAFGNGQVRAEDLAYLTDRVRVNSGQPQVYGTQFWRPPGPSGKLEPRPIEDEANLDQLRATMGLGPFAEYRKLMTGE